eukprot:scaffold306295_cov42-Prasinocladus_malaysianus.AAC.1
MLPERNRSGKSSSKRRLRSAGRRLRRRPRPESEFPGSIHLTICLLDARRGQRNLLGTFEIHAAADGRREHRRRRLSKSCAKLARKH